MVAVDLGTAEPIAVGYVNEYNSQVVQRWLEPLVQQHGVTVIVTDDLFSYKIVTEKLHIGHQACQFHISRWVGRTFKEFQESISLEWLWVLNEFKQLIEMLTPGSSKHLHTHWKQLPDKTIHQVFYSNLWEFSSLGRWILRSVEEKHCFWHCCQRRSG